MARTNRTHTLPLVIATADNGEPVFRLSPSTVKALIAHASTDETRAALNSVLFTYDPEKHVATAVATDGHRMVKIETSDRHFEDVQADKRPTVAKTSLVRVTDLARAAKLAPRGGVVAIAPNCTTYQAWGTQETGGFPASPMPQDAVTSGALVDAQFPPTEQIVSTAPVASYDRPASGRIGFQPKYLGDVQLVCDALGALGAEFAFASAAEPTKYRTEKDCLDPSSARVSSGTHGTTALVVVMPMRI